MNLMCCYREKKVAPAKPKRKSICQNPGQEKKARVRYYDEMKQDQNKSNPEANSPIKNVSGEIDSNEQGPSLKGQVAKLNKLSYHQTLFCDSQTFVYRDPGRRAENYLSRSI